MRLIDADKLLEFMRNKLDMQDMYLPIHFKELIIDEMPTAYDIDKVVEELEENYFQEGIKNPMCIELDKAIEIVKAGGKNEC